MTLKNLITSVWIAIFIISSIYSQDSNYNVSPTGTDPTDILTRFDASLVRIDPLSAGYILELAGGGDIAITKWGSIGINVPLVYADFPSTETFEMGDIKLKALISFLQQPEESVFKAAAIGVNYSMDTGDIETGTGFGQAILAPYITASFYVADEIMIAPFVQEFIGLEKDKSNRTFNQLDIRIITVFTFEESIWLELTPELIIDLEGTQKKLWALRSSLGTMINPKAGFSAEFVAQLAGEKRFDYLAGISMRYLIK